MLIVITISGFSPSIVFTAIKVRMVQIHVQVVSGLKGGVEAVIVAIVGVHNLVVYRLIWHPVIWHLCYVLLSHEVGSLVEA